MASKSFNLNERLPQEEDPSPDPSLLPKTLDSPAPASLTADFNSPATASDHSPSALAATPASAGQVTAPEDVKRAKDPVESLAAEDVPVDEVERKIRRAERFGVPVQLSEQEKRNSRAERFGTGTGSSQPVDTNKSEELKRKARAERFGISSSAAAADEKVKKKARLARFSGAKVEPEEEEKRKARAIRFSNPPTSCSITQSNGDGPIAGNSNGGGS